MLYSAPGICDKSTIAIGFIANLEYILSGFKVFNPKFYIFANNLNLKPNNMSDIASRVKAIIVDKLGVDENEVVNEASFTNDLGADSLDTVELIMEFEKEFDIQIPDDQAENIACLLYTSPSPRD